MNYIKNVQFYEFRKKSYKRLEVQPMKIYAISEEDKNFAIMIIPITI